MMCRKSKARNAVRSVHILIHIIPAQHRYLRGTLLIVAVPYLEFAAQVHAVKRVRMH